MSGGFEVDTEVLRSHATRVGQVADGIAMAQSASGTTALDGGAFGFMCSFLPPLISGVDSAARQALSSVGTAAEGAVTELGSMARGFDDLDARVRDRMRGVAQDIGA